MRTSCESLEHGYFHHLTTSEPGKSNRSFPRLKLPVYQRFFGPDLPVPSCPRFPTKNSQKSQDGSMGRTVWCTYLYPQKINHENVGKYTNSSQGFNGYFHNFAVLCWIYVYWKHLLETWGSVLNLNLHTSPELIKLDERTVRIFPSFQK